jgi:hypothetical protein
MSNDPDKTMDPIVFAVVVHVESMVVVIPLVMLKRRENSPVILSNLPVRQVKVLFP